MVHQIVLLDDGSVKTVTASVFLKQAARKLGFVRDPSLSDAYMATYVQTYTDPYGYSRKIDIQFWKDGKHRAAHTIHGYGFTTTPTPFTDLEGMYLAIATEQTRRDNKAYQQCPKKLTFNDAKKNLLANPDLKTPPANLYDDAAWDEFYNSHPIMKDGL